MDTYFLQRQAIGQPGSVGTCQPIQSGLLARLAVGTSGGGHTVESTRQAMESRARMADGTWSYQHPRTHAVYGIAVCRHSTKG